MQLRTARATTFHGKPAYRLGLSKGKAWAIRGEPAVVVPLAMKDASYNENVSVFLQSGPYVLYFPDLYETPESFNTFIGKRPGMTVIDTDAYR
jgi:hypothetical protein